MSAAAVEPSPPASELKQVVSNALDTSPYIAGGNVRIEAGAGRVELHGHVGTFFEKQMAQEVVRRIDGVDRVENLLQVAWS